ncbi:MAG: ATP-binding protein [Hyphomicrobium sp.]|nr:ATP-binding protein [Hyphomicrobium sp.]
MATVVVVAVLASVCLASLMSAGRDTYRRAEAKQGELEGIAQAISATVAEPLKAGDQRRVANALRAIGSIPGIRYVRVNDEKGRTFFQLGSGVVVGQPVVDGHSGWSFNLSTFPVEAPVVFAGARIGTLTIVADVSELKTAFMDSVISALLAGIVSALAGFLAVQRLQRSVTGPILELKSAIETKRADMDFARPVARTSEDETGELVVAFNTMIEDIRARDTALAAHRDRLEADVADRTRDLAAATKVAEDASAAKSEFLATMSHEIRTPMHALLVMAELLSVDELPPEARRRSEVIVKSGRLLLSIINDILDFSKIEAGRLDLESVPIGPGAIVEDVLQLFEERAASAGLDLACHVAPDVPAEMAGDPVRLTQILSNLVNNALKFTETGGVLVRVARTDRPDGGAGIRFDIVDTGIGIPEHKIGAIFDAFTQAEQSTTRRFGGTGIGLTICRRLVGAIGGEIGVESRVGEGSTFWFEIPAVGATARAADGAEGQAIRGRRLAIDLKSGPMRDALLAMARDFDVEVVTGQKFEEADAVIIDVSAYKAAMTSIAQVTGPVLMIAKLGDATALAAQAAGHVDAILGVPVGGHSTRVALIGALSGRPVMSALPSTLAGGVLQAKRLEGVRVLAADDNAINREVLIEALKRIGVSVVCVDDGQAAVDAVREGDFDLVLMDGSMPGMDGFEATRIIRAEEREQGRVPVPIVALTAHVIGQGADAWADAGMSDYLAKPFTLAGLRACVERWAGDKVCGARQISEDADAGSQDGKADALSALTSKTTRDRIDFEVLASIGEMQAAGDDLLTRIIGLYRSHAPDLAKAIETAVAAGSDDVALRAHALKSLCRNIGAVAVGDICEEIETRAGRGEAVDNLAAQLQPEVELAIRLLSAWNEKKDCGSEASPKRLTA